jgi:hypothetical protein
MKILREYWTRIVLLASLLKPSKSILDDGTDYRMLGEDIVGVLAEIGILLLSIIAVVLSPVIVALGMVVQSIMRRIKSNKE